MSTITPAQARQSMHKPVNVLAPNYLGLEGLPEVFRWNGYLQIVEAQLPAEELSFRVCNHSKTFAHVTVSYYRYGQLHPAQTKEFDLHPNELSPHVGVQIEEAFGIFEVELRGPRLGNPKEEIHAIFTVAVNKPAAQ